MKKTSLVLFLVLGLVTLKATAQTTKTPETSTPFTIADSSVYIGKYKYEGLPFEYMTIRVREDKLYYEGGEYSGFLQPVKDKKDVFDASGAALFTFFRNEQKAVVELNIDYQGQSFLGKRETK